MLGMRIRQARLLANMTQKEVVINLAKLGISATPAVISKYEKNKSTPAPSFIIALAQIFNVPTTYFLHQSKVEIEWIAYRKHSHLSKQAQEMIQTYAQDVVELQHELLQLLYPHAHVDMPQPTIVNTDEDAEALAQTLRHRWELADLPIENLTHLAETKGVMVIMIKSPENIERFDGLSGWSNQHTPVSVVSNRMASDRRRFNLAHEIGHLLMQTPQAQAESLAHRFAGALLVPKEVAYHELGRKRTHISLNEFGSLKKRYGLSIQGWIYRAKDLGIISDALARQLWQEINLHGWKRTEPPQYDFIADETPALLVQMSYRAVSEGLISPERVQQVLPQLEFGLKPMMQRDFPTPTQLLAMSEEERQKWIMMSFEVAKDIEFEQFDAFGEEYF